MSRKKSKVSVNYTSKDFDSIRDDLVRLAERFYPDSFLDFSEKEKLDCRYVGVSEEHFPSIVRERYSERMMKVPSSIIFFLIYDGTDELLYEVDLDKNSNFHEIEKKQNSQ